MEMMEKLKKEESLLSLIFGGKTLKQGTYVLDFPPTFPSAPSVSSCLIQCDNSTSQVSPLSTMSSCSPPSKPPYG